MQPEMLIVAGANGSGKTTFAYQYARKHGWAYLGADAIAAELAAAGASSQVEAGRQFFLDYDRHLQNRQSFIVETTLSGLGFRRMIGEAQRAGFRVSIYYFYVNSAAVCIARVTERVRKGGHHVPDADVRRRFHRSFANFWNIYRPMTDSWVVMYNQLNGTEEIVFGERDEFVIVDSTRFAEFLRLVDGENADD